MFGSVACCTVGRRTARMYKAVSQLVRYTATWGVPASASSMFTVPLQASASCAALYASKRSALSSSTTRGRSARERRILWASVRSACLG